MDEDFKNYVKDKLDMLCSAIMGDPTDLNNPGLILRIDRLEQSNKLKGKIICALGLGVAYTLGQAIVNLL